MQVAAVLVRPQSTCHPSAGDSSAVAGRTRCHLAEQTSVDHSFIEFCVDVHLGRMAIFGTCGTAAIDPCRLLLLHFVAFE